MARSYLHKGNLEPGLGFYELMLIPISLLLEKDQLMHEVDKVAFVKLCLEDKINLLTIAKTLI